MKLLRTQPPLRARMLIFCALGFTLGGCAYQAAPLRPEPMALPADYPEAAALGGRAQGPLSNKWWKSFKDPLLNELMEQAWRQNADVAIAAARISEAEAYRRQVGAAGFPEIYFNAGATRSGASSHAGKSAEAGAVRSDFKLGLSSHFELDFWGRLRHADQAAAGRLLASQAGREVVLWSLSKQVALAALRLRQLDLQLELGRQQRDVLLQTQSLQQNKQAQGLIGFLEVMPIQDNLQQLAFEQAGLQHDRAQTEHVLALLTGQPDLVIGPQLEIQTTDAVLDAPPPGLPSQLLLRRPDLRQAQALLAAAYEDAQTAEANLYPSISLTGGLGQESSALGHLLQAGSRFWNVGLDVDVPVFDMGRRQAQSAQARARQTQAQLQYIKAAQTAFVEVRDALSLGQSTRQQLQSIRLQLQQMEAKQRLVQAKQRAGTVSQLEVLEVMRLELGLKKSYQLAWLQTASAKVGLLTVLGGAWDKE